MILIPTMNDTAQPAFTCSMKLFPAKMYLFKINNRNIRKGVKYVQS